MANGSDDLRSNMLELEKIITHFFYDYDTSDIVVELNHQYDGKKITSTLELEEWTSSIQEFKDKMQLEDIALHITMICDNLANNYERILKYVKSQSNDNSNSKKKEKRESHLHERVILSGKPVFIKYDG